MNIFTTSVFAREKILIATARKITNGPLFMRRGRFTPAATQLFSSKTNEKRESLVQTELNPEVGVATMTLARPPVNALSLEMYVELYRDIFSFLDCVSFFDESLYVSLVFVTSHMLPYLTRMLVYVQV